MRTPSAVIDTNVVVSGVLVKDPTSPPARIVTGMVRGRFPFLLSQDLLAEYRKVLLRPKIAERHGLSEEEIDALLTDIVASAAMRSPGNPAESAPDPDDDHVWALLTASLDTEGKALLVTGDRLLVDNPPPGRSVVYPVDFSELMNRA